MNKIIFTFTILIFGCTLQAQEVERTPFSIGDVLEFKSNILDENRIINIYLPESYNPDSLNSYPVIYLLDGSKDEDFIHISGLVQFCSFSWINTIPETIVVGIANIDRKRDFTYPSSAQIDQDEFPTSGGSELFMSFIEKELKPLINKEYRISDEETIIGQSLGALLTTEILIKNPDLFDNYIIMSPSLWWDNELLLQVELSETINNKKIYIGVGNEGPLMVRVAKELHSKLESELADSSNLHFQYFENRNHGDALHPGALDAFEKLFSEQK